MEQVLNEFVREVQHLYGSDLVAVFLYGSAVTGEHVPGRSDINVAVLLADVTAAALRKASGKPPRLGPPGIRHARVLRSGVPARRAGRVSHRAPRHARAPPDALRTGRLGRAADRGRSAAPPVRAGTAREAAQAPAGVPRILPIPDGPADRPHRGSQRLDRAGPDAPALGAGGRERRHRGGVPASRNPVRRPRGASPQGVAAQARRGARDGIGDRSAVPSACWRSFSTSCGW